MRRKFLLFLVCVPILAGVAVADPIAVGTLDFQTVIPGEEQVGVNAFFTVNLTGNGPDFFPSPASFSNATLTLHPTAGSAISYFISSLASGQYFPSEFFPETTTFSSATLSGVLDGLNWTLSAVLLPVGSSSVLTSGQIAIIYADGEYQTQEPEQPASRVPEPTALALLGTALSGIAIGRLRSDRVRAQG